MTIDDNILFKIMYDHTKIYCETWNHDYHTRWINIINFPKFLLIVDNQESHNRMGYKEFIAHQNLCLKSHLFEEKKFNDKSNYI